MDLIKARPNPRPAAPTTEEPMLLTEAHEGGGCELGNSHAR